MLHVVEHTSQLRSAPDAAMLWPQTVGEYEAAGVAAADYGFDDIEIVDDSLLNTAPSNKIERQLLNGDVVGLALMSGAILWSTMGVFG